MGITDELRFEAADDALRLFSKTTMADTGVSIRSIQVSTPYGNFEMYIDGQSRRYEGWRGFFRARVETAGASKVDADNMRQLMNSVGLDSLTTNPTAADELILKKTRLVWQHAPQRTQELKGLTATQRAAKLDLIMKQESINTGQLAKMKVSEVFDGYTTYVNEAIGDEYKKAGTALRLERHNRRRGRGQDRKQPRTVLKQQQVYAGNEASRSVPNTRL